MVKIQFSIKWLGHQHSATFKSQKLRVKKRLAFYGPFIDQRITALTAKGFVANLGANR